MRRHETPREHVGRHSVAIAAFVVMAAVMAACSGTGSSGSTPSSGSESASSPPAGQPGVPDIPKDWAQQDVSFVVDGVTVHGTYLHPSASARRVPGTVLIAGSGPTDRNGNSPQIAGSANTLRNLAASLASEGVSSVRYDKLGSGKTGLGKFAAHPDAIGIEPFVDEAAGALKFLARQPQVDRERLSIYGHSEGALFALLVATGHTKDAPSVHSLGLIEPLSKRYLNTITEQVTRQIHQQHASGKIDKHTADKVVSLLHKTVTQLRNRGTVPPDLGYGLANLFNPGTLKFLRQADAIDPASLAAKLPATTPVLITCSDADIQVSCSDSEHLADAVQPKALDFVHLHDVSHVLKQDPGGTAANYGESLPFSHQVVAALRTFTKQ